MSYFRKRTGLGDGPVTSPSQVDDTIIGGQIAPTRVDCATLPADSPWRQPGQACAPSTGLSNLLDYFGGLFGKAAQVLPGQAPGTPVAADPGTSTSTLLLLAGAGGLAYYLFTKKKKGP